MKILSEIRLEIFLGTNIHDVDKIAERLATRYRVPVVFLFNGEEHRYGFLKKISKIDVKGK